MTLLVVFFFFLKDSTGVIISFCKMFWKSKVFHPVWMPLEPRQRNYRTWEGPAKAIQVYISTFLHFYRNYCSSLEWSNNSEAVFIWFLSSGSRAGWFHPPACCSSSSQLLSCADITFLWVRLLFSWISSLLWIPAQARQQSRQGWGGHGASSDLCWN